MTNRAWQYFQTNWKSGIARSWPHPKQNLNSTIPYELALKLQALGLITHQDILSSLAEPTHI